MKAQLMAIVWFSVALQMAMGEGKMDLKRVELLKRADLEDSSLSVQRRFSYIPSCEGFCGKTSWWCLCKASCLNKRINNCCPNFKAKCPEEAAKASCKGRCNGEAPSGCHCDPSCRQVGDCCLDFEGQCPNQFRIGDTCLDYCKEDTLPNYTAVCEQYCARSVSCEGKCNGMAASGCHCDPSCRQKEDCCPDFGAKCSAQYDAGGNICVKFCGKNILPRHKDVCKLYCTRN